MIFAITAEQKSVYDKLSKYIEGSVVGQLANDSNNIVTLVRDNYNVSNSLNFLASITMPQILSFTSDAPATNSFS